MKSTFKFSIFTFNLALAIAATAAAQGPPPRAASPWRITIGANAGVQTGRDQSQSFSVEKNAEGAPIAASLGLPRAALLDASLSIGHARHRAGFSLAVSQSSRRFGGDVSAQIPHPFFFNMHRPVSGSISRLLDTEAAGHFDVTYTMWTSRRAIVTGFAGPSIFRITQDLVTDVIFSDAYPYDTAAFVAAPTTRVSATSFGLNVGADVTWRASRRVGLGALVRYSRGSATLTPSAGNDVEVTVGGLQAGAGLRFAF